MEPRVALARDFAATPAAQVAESFTVTKRDVAFGTAAQREAAPLDLVTKSDRRV